MNQLPASMHDREYYGPVICAALVPLAGTLLLGWSIYEVMMVYWLEGLILGLFVLARLYIQPPWRIGSMLARLHVMLFFLSFLLSFAATHLMVIMILFHPAGPEEFEFPEDPDEIVGWFKQGWLLLPALFLLIPQCWQFLRNWLLQRGWEETSSLRLALGLFSRLLITHAGVILAAVLVVHYHAPILMVPVLIAAKLALDLGAIRIGRRFDQIDMSALFQRYSELAIKKLTGRDSVRRL